MDEALKTQECAGMEGLSSSSEPKKILEYMLKEVVRRKGTDLHLKAWSIPYIRIYGDMVPLNDCFIMDDVTVQKLIFSCMTGQQNAHFVEDMDIDFSYSLPGLARFRVNALFEKNYLGAVFRYIPENPLSIEELGVPETIKPICLKKQGLVIVAGRTGNGKTSTLAGALRYINENRKIHVITIEDPIEYSFVDIKAFIRQREVGAHTKSFATGLKYALRQDPDVIIVGEMRDLETIAIALTAAETGHLVFSTLHTFGSVETINRIIDPFPPAQQTQIRLQLSTTLEAVFAQCLIPKLGEHGVVLGMEVLIATPAVRNMIRESRVHQLKQIVESQVEGGMISMEKSLIKLYEQKKISLENVYAYCVDSNSLRELLKMHGIL